MNHWQKKFLFAIALTTNFFPSYCPAKGFYAGIGLNHESAHFDKNLVIDDIATGRNEYYKLDKLAGNGIAGDFFAGYGHSFNKFYLAGEINANISSLKYSGYYIDKANSEMSNANFTLEKSYGISLLPGYKITNDSLIYGRLGYVKGNFKYAEYKDNVEGVTERNWLNGFRYGLGVATALTQQVGLRFEYNHLSYQNFRNNNFPGFPGKIRTITIKPEIDLFELALVYQFQ